MPILTSASTRLAIAAAAVIRMVLAINPATIVKYFLVMGPFAVTTLNAQLRFATIPYF
jgi:hypothetical protein